MSRAARRAALKKGRRGEWLALVFLILKGWRICARNYSAQGGEIDLIAWRGSVIAFVEVKARRDFASAETAIDGFKLNRIARAADHWLNRHPWAMTRTLRVDAIDIVPWRWPRHRTDIAPLG